MSVKNIFLTSRIRDPKSIPIIINNRNRLTTLTNLIVALEKRGYFNIYIIDNDSKFPPLLEYYKQIRYQVFFLNKNMGYLAIWKSKVYKKFYKDFYVYTDSDVVPVDECPDDFMELFRKTLLDDKGLQKVGFSLKIDDLPDHYAHKSKVISWERQFFKKPVSDLFFEANIDTTFALYRPGSKGGSSHLRMYRSASPYEARHLPWYVDSENLTPEEKFYLESIETRTDWGII